MKRADTTAVKVLTGEFAKSPLAEVLHLLHQDKETATLVCRNGDKKRAIFLWRGQVADVDTSVPGEKLVDMLRSMGKVEAGSTRRRKCPRRPTRS